MRTVAELRAWVGREAYDPFGLRVGVVAGLRADRATGAPEWLVVALGGDGGDLRAVPVVGSEPSGFAVRVTPSADRVASSPGLPAEDDLTVERDRVIAEHYGLVFDTRASPSGIPRRPEAVRARAQPVRDQDDPVVGPGRRAALVDALRRAHAMEEAALKELATGIRESEDDELVHDLKLHHKETGRHAERLRDRLWMLRADRSKERDMGAKVRAFLGARGRVGTLADLERREIEAYDELERLAVAAGDDATAQLARDNRADEEAMLSTLRFGRRQWPVDEKCM
jgi:ferritin-like metal-binding protein YciE